jgi:NADH:ubiquinone oxidoreductase subunit E/NAD-dependent dihydropyrimidine dehydrogenase PreA subunit
MGKINVVIDGLKAVGEPGETILAVSGRMGVDIPTLCHKEELKPSGVCRICVVEVEGAPRLVASCHTPIAEGMVIHTASPKVLTSRRITLELLMAGHTGPCVTDPLADACELHQLASQVELGLPRFDASRPRSYAIEDGNPYVVRDLSRCILCRRCVGACEEIAGQAVFSVAYRGFESKIIVGTDQPLDLAVCRDCGVCVDFCPTSALKRKTEKKEVRDSGMAQNQGNSKAFERADREGILAALKDEQIQNGFVSQNAIDELGKRFQRSPADIYGATSFYAFLSTEPLGRNVIRVCKSLPCFLKNGRFLLRAIYKAIGIGPGETTEDGRYSVELTNCIGACDQAPAIMINHEVHGGLTPEDIPGILGSYE